MKVICNGSSIRPFCNECKARCSTSVYFKFSNETVACSIINFFTMSDVRNVVNFFFYVIGQVYIHSVRNQFIRNLLYVKDFRNNETN